MREITFLIIFIFLAGCIQKSEKKENDADTIKKNKLDREHAEAIWTFYLMYFDKKCSGFEKREKPANASCWNDKQLGLVSIKGISDYDASQNFEQDSLQGIGMFYAFGDCDCIEAPPFFLRGTYSDSSLISNYIFDKKGNLVYLEHRNGWALELKERKDIYDKIYSPARETQLKEFIRNNLESCDSLLIKEAKRRKLI